jgi:hypothetical protein
MNSEIRDCILAAVSGMRGEKRAAMSDENRDALARAGAGLTPLLSIPLAAAVNRHSRKYSDRRRAYINDGPAVTKAEKILESLKIEGVPLRKWLSNHGVGLANRVEFGGLVPGPLVMPRVGAGRKFLDSLGDVTSEKKGPAGMMFLGFKENTPSSAVRDITAHEVGHVSRLAAGKLKPRLYGGSKILTNALATTGLLRASLGREISGSEAAGWQAATALAALPMLNEEVQASRVGSRLAGLRGLKRLGAFRGVPSYVAAASVPAAAYGARKLLNKLLDVDKKK